ncbi:MAG: FAD binding domain-containing protein [Caldilineaceae bacterium]|nr:FAD binding domain-containing protein [Caldilineaceae bacterium]
MYRFYTAPSTLAAALAQKAQHGPFARVMAGGTDLLVELDRGVRKAPDGNAPGLIDLTQIPGLAEITEVDGWIHLGPLVTHNQCVASPLLVEKAFPLARACWEIGAPQIRNRATLAGNLITASPANDAIVPLLALDTHVTLQSAACGERTLPLRQFLSGFRKVDLADDEILTRLAFPALTSQHHGVFIKLGLRRAQAISVLSVAVIVEAEGDPAQSPVRDARISLGAVAPTIVRAADAEAYLVGKVLTDAVLAEAGRLALSVATPIDDVRSTAAYRRGMVETLVVRALRQVRAGQARAGWSAQPVLLWGQTNGQWPVVTSPTAPAMPAMVNGQAVQLPGAMTLLDSLRATGFVGVKEGCAEGECGACTVFLDGMAVMACLVPAERAAGSTIVTVEGLAQPDQLHPVQAALVQSGGVQCGYCTPGFVMSAAKLLEERPHPTREEAKQALTGNLCRCTGYRKILDAVVSAGGTA